MLTYGEAVPKTYREIYIDLFSESFFFFRKRTIRDRFHDFQQHSGVARTKRVELLIAVAYLNENSIHTTNLARPPLIPARITKQ